MLMNSRWQCLVIKYFVSWHFLFLLPNKTVNCYHCRIAAAEYIFHFAFDSTAEHIPHTIIIVFDKCRHDVDVWKLSKLECYKLIN